MAHYLRHAGRYFTRLNGVFIEATEPPIDAIVVALGDDLVVTGGRATVPTAKTMKPIDVGKWVRGTIVGTYVERDVEGPAFVRVEVCVLIDETADRKRNRLIGTRVWASPEDVRVPEIKKEIPAHAC